MSKKVKKQKTVEELLEEALVPVEEQPYEIPENWVWVYSEFVAKWGSGGTPSRKHPEYYGGEIPWIKTGDLRDTTIKYVQERITEEGLKKSSAKLFPKGSVAIAMYGATIGRLGILDYAASTNQACAVAVPRENTTTNYLYYYFKLQRNNLINMGKGGAQPNISQSLIKKYPFALPPIDEQKRIADKVERLLNKIDEAKRLIDEAKETFELRRAAILDKAFRGELTGEWRKENQPTQNADNLLKYISEKKKSSDIKINTNDLKEVNHKEYPYPLPEGWSWVKLGELAYYVTSGSRGWSKYYSEDGSLFIRTQDINTNKLVLNHVAHMNLPEKVEGKRSLIEENDILTTITGANVGKCALVDFDISEAYVSQSVALTKLVDKRLSKYVHLSLISPNGGGGELKEKAYGIGRPVLSLEDIKNIKIPMAPLIEQKEVINKAEKLLMAEENSMNLINLEKRLDDLRINILSKAFKGKLGTNDLREENSLKSLTEILNGR